MNYHDAMALIEENKTLAARAIEGKVFVPFLVSDEFLCAAWQVVPRNMVAK